MIAYNAVNLLLIFNADRARKDPRMQPAIFIQSRRLDRASRDRWHTRLKFTAGNSKVREFAKRERICPATAT